jgi:hypothetical protein
MAAMPARVDALPAIVAPNQTRRRPTAPATRPPDVRCARVGDRCVAAHRVWLRATQRPGCDV